MKNIIKIINVILQFPLFTVTPGYRNGGNNVQQSQSNSHCSQEQPYFWFGWRTKDLGCSSSLLQQPVNYIQVSALKFECFFITFMTYKTD